MIDFLAEVITGKEIIIGITGMIVTKEMIDCRIKT